MFEKIAQFFKRLFKPCKCKMKNLDELIRNYLEPSLDKSYAVIDTSGIVSNDGREAIYKLIMRGTSTVYIRLEYVNPQQLDTLIEFKEGELAFFEIDEFFNTIQTIRNIINSKRAEIAGYLQLEITKRGGDV